ncbi:16325_t:CDS:2, partial [Funneliformis caledonium]
KEGMMEFEGIGRDLSKLRVQFVFESASDDVPTSKWKREDYEDFFLFKSNPVIYNGSCQAENLSEIPLTISINDSRNSKNTVSVLGGMYIWFGEEWSSLKQKVKVEATC